MSEQVEVPDDLLAMYADAQLDSAKPWHWMQIAPSKIIALIERIAKQEALLRERDLRIEALEAEVKVLRHTESGTISVLEAQVAALSTPVTDAEWTLISVPMNWKLQTRTELVYAAIRASVNALLAARKGASA